MTIASRSSGCAYRQLAVHQRGALHPLWPLWNVMPPSGEMHFECACAKPKRSTIVRTPASAYKPCQKSMLIDRKSILQATNCAFNIDKACLCGALSWLLGITAAMLCRFWSDPQTWADLPPELAHSARISNVTGLPDNGANLTIPATWTLEIDTDTAVLDHLELQGALMFSKVNATSLNIHSLAIPLGSITAGNSTHPHPAPVCTPLPVHAMGTALFGCSCPAARYHSV
jgi:G8 domain